MMRWLGFCVLWLLFLATLTACEGLFEVVGGSARLPTLQATVILPTPTVGTTPTPTVRPTRTARPTPRPTATMIAPQLDINLPGRYAVVRQGERLRVAGRGQAAADWRIEVALLSLDGRLLDAQPTQLNRLNRWEVALQVPHQLGGVARVQATLFSAEGQVLAQDLMPIYLQAHTVEGRSLDLYRPLVGETAVAGYNLYFDGRVQNPVRNLITIAVRADQCQNEVARQRFVLNGSGYWQGFLILPDTLAGELCAVAYFGEAGTAEWRETQLPLIILPSDYPEGYGLLVANRLEQAELVGGRPLTLYGTAYNAPNGEVAISLTLADGTSLAAGRAAVDRYGYWEMDVLLPVGITAEAQLQATLGQGAQIYAQQTFLIDLVSP